jgi:hypothetical protein
MGVKRPPSPYTTTQSLRLQPPQTISKRNSFSSDSEVPLSNTSNNSAINGDSEIDLLNLLLRKDETGGRFRPAIDDRYFFVIIVLL